VRIELANVSRSFGSHHVLNRVTASLDFTHTLALIGPSGGGKSTLLRLLAALDVPDAGEIRCDGQVLPRDAEERRLHRSRVGIVFQAFNLFPHLSALENTSLPLEHVHGVPRSESLERAAAVLRRFQLESHAHKKPASLSGGQRQRVAIARSLVTSPQLLLMDEPTSALDPEMTAEVLDVIAELRLSGAPIVLVTHEMGFARQSADLIAFVADGGIGESGPAGAFFESPQTEICRRFLGRVLKY